MCLVVKNMGKRARMRIFSGVVNRMGRPNLPLTLAMVGQALPDLCYCLVYPEGWEVDGADEQTTIIAHGAFSQGGCGSVLGGNNYKSPQIFMG
ncbi:MAG: hypothetical protein WB564_06420 [Dehalococcoidia bacterium]